LIKREKQGIFKAFGSAEESEANETRVKRRAHLYVVPTCAASGG